LYSKIVLQLLKFGSLTKEDMTWEI